MNKTIVAAVAFNLFFGVLYADDLLEYTCARPIKPAKFVENRDVERYNKDVQNYRGCMDEFVAKNKEIVDAHTTAIKEAINDWNGFVAGTKKKQKEDRKFVGEKTGVSHTVGQSDPYKLTTGFKF